jgi:hypothetical protein
VGGYVTERDSEVLKHLTDVSTTVLTGDDRGFELTFTFSDNAFFSNKTLTKKYVLEPEDDVIPKKFEGCKINWKDDKLNPTVEAVRCGSGLGCGHERSLRACAACLQCALWQAKSSPGGMEATGGRTASVLGLDFEARSMSGMDIKAHTPWLERLTNFLPCVSGSRSNGVRSTAQTLGIAQRGLPVYGAPALTHVEEHALGSGAPKDA